MLLPREVAAEPGLGAAGPPGNAGGSGGRAAAHKGRSRCGGFFLGGGGDGGDPVHRLCPSPGKSLPANPARQQALHTRAVDQHKPLPTGKKIIIYYRPTLSFPLG